MRLLFAAAALLAVGAARASLGPMLADTAAIRAAGFPTDIVGAAAGAPAAQSNERRGRVVDYSTVVRTTGGFVAGYVDGESRVFRGIPYAQAERFGAPQAPTPWAGIRDATVQNPMCLQAPYTPFLPGLNYTAFNVAEDCLFATVYAPKSGGCGRRYPVVVVIHGDTHVTGGTALDDKKGLSDHGDVIVVSFDYRLGAVAQMVLPGMEAASNLWFQDQQAALLWVKANAAAFGGNPDRVTLLGDASGAFDALLHVTTGNNVIYPKRIIAKTPAHFNYRNISEATDLTVAWAAEAPRGCNQTTSAAILACLRALPLAAVTAPSGLGVGPRSVFGPGTAFAMQPIELILAGHYDKSITVMMGSTNETGAVYALAITYYTSGLQSVTPFADISAPVFNGITAWYFGARVGLPAATVGAIIQMYGALATQPGWNYGKALSAAVAESFYDCPTRELRAAFARDGVRQYGYDWTHYPDNPMVNYTDLAASYGTDSSFMYGNDDMQGYPQYVAAGGFSEFEKDEFIPVVQDWLTRFARRGRPGNGWKKYVADGPASHGVNSIGAGSAEVTTMVPAITYGGRCAFWEVNRP